MGSSVEINPPAAAPFSFLFLFSETGIFKEISILVHFYFCISDFVWMVYDLVLVGSVFVCLFVLLALELCQELSCDCVSSSLFCTQLLCPPSWLPIPRSYVCVTYDLKGIGGGGRISLILLTGMNIYL